MRRKKEGRKFYGPYYDRGRWKVIIVERDGSRATQSFGSEVETAAVIEDAKTLEARRRFTVTAVLELYEQHQTRKGKRPGSIATTGTRLSGLLAEVTHLYSLTPKVARTSVAAYQKGRAVATARSTLRDAKTFGRWLVREELADSNPFEACEVLGVENRGKDTLTHEEMDRFVAKCFELGAAGDPRALAPMVALWCNLRASEVVGLTRRDLDREGQVIWAARKRGKTKNARRSLIVPVPLSSMLWRAFKDLDPAARLWARNRDWLYRETRKIGDLVSIDKLGPQRLRATHATIAHGHGATSEVVAAAMGHGSDGVTRQHYIAPEAQAEHTQRAFLRVMDGGK